MIRPTMTIQHITCIVVRDLRDYAEGMDRIENAGATLRNRHNRASWPGFVQGRAAKRDAAPPGGVVRLVDFPRRRRVEQELALCRTDCPPMSAIVYNAVLPMPYADRLHCSRSSHTDRLKRN